MAGTGRGFEVTTGLVIQQGIWNESSTAKHKIGTRMQLADGRVFYYAQANGALAAGKLCTSPVAVANHIEILTAAVAAIGAKAITSLDIGATAMTANQYAEGWLQTNKVTGLGYSYKIKSHTSASSSGAVDVVLYDPIQVATDATTEFSFIYNPFAEVIVQATITEPPCGVPLFVVQDNYYAWLQTWGVCALLCGGTDASGMRLVAHTTDGSVTGYTTASEATSPHTSPHVGYAYGTVGVADEYKPVMLQLFP
jgi:hypothetical protein